MPPWVERPTLNLDLDADWTDQAVPEDAIASAKRLLGGVMGEIPSSARFLAYLARLRTWGRFQKEIHGMARWSGADWRDIMLANLSYDLVLGRLGCSTLALASRSGPVLARNMDWWPEDLLAQASYLLRYERRAQLQFASASFPGAVGVVTGISQRGFALALNAVINPDGFARTGYPVLLFLRCVLEDARDFDDAVSQCKRQRLTTAALITLVGRDNRQRVILERTPTRCAERWPEAPGKPLVATNHFRLLAPAAEVEGMELYESTCHRFEALQGYFNGASEDVEFSDDRLLYALSDPNVIQSITAQHVLLQPATGKARLFVPRHLT